MFGDDGDGVYWGRVACETLIVRSGFDFESGVLGEFFWLLACVGHNGLGFVSVDSCRGRKLTIDSCEIRSIYVRIGCVHAGVVSTIYILL